MRGGHGKLCERAPCTAQATRCDHEPLPPPSPPRSSLASLQRWAAEVAHLGTFAAPYSEDRASLNLGGLPVPCLVVGNKQDLVPKFRAKYVRGWREQVNDWGGRGLVRGMGSSSMWQTSGCLVGCATAVFQ